MHPKRDTSRGRGLEERRGKGREERRGKRTRGLEERKYAEEGNPWMWATPTTFPLEEDGGSLLRMVCPPPVDGVDPLEAFLSSCTFTGEASEEVRRELFRALSSWPSEESLRKMLEDVAPPSNSPLPLESEGSIQP